MKTGKKKNKEEPTFLDILPKDIKDNILQVYRNQIKYDNSFLYDILLDRYGILISDTENQKAKNKLLEKMYDVLDKYNIKLKFIKEKDYELEEGDTPVTSIDLITDVLYVYIRGLLSGGTIEVNTKFTELNGEMKDFNIPVRIVRTDNIESGGKFEGYEIIRFNIIAHEINLNSSY